MRMICKRRKNPDFGIRMRNLRLSFCNNYDFDLLFENFMLYSLGMFTAAIYGVIDRQKSHIHMEVKYNG